MPVADPYLVWETVSCFFFYFLNFKCMMPQRLLQIGAYMCLVQYVAAHVSKLIYSLKPVALVDTGPCFKYHLFQSLFD